MTPEQDAKLSALADQIKTDVNPHTGVPYVMFLGRVGIGTEWRCRQPNDADNSVLSVDSKDPNPVWIEIGEAPVGQDMTAITVFVSEHNDQHKMVGLDVTAQGGNVNVPLRLNGEGIEVVRAGSFKIGRETQPGVWTTKDLFQS
jgi:hypothetical protein